MIFSNFSGGFCFVLGFYCKQNSHLGFVIKDYHFAVQEVCDVCLGGDGLKTKMPQTHCSLRNSWLQNSSAKYRINSVV